MQYDVDLPMWDWVTKVEDLAHHLEDIKSPMIPIDIINTLTHDLPDSYAPFIVFVNSLLDDPNFAANFAIIQEVIKCLLNEEACQAEANHHDFPQALLARHHKQSPMCYNCGESGHFRFDCNISPWEIQMCHEQKSHGLKWNEESARVAVHNVFEADSEDIPPNVY